MRIRVLVFGAAAETLGRGAEVVEVAHGATVGDALGALLDARPELAPALRLAAFAVNRRYVRREHALAEGDEVAFVPPVSGG
ncbi:MAG TPA: MoaD/ThiS family protein [Planctomycetota bacterium]|nr:MoaD/ThiS family protein [Planctomycetota bacterium]